MMRLFAITAILVGTAQAYADESAALADRLVDFALDGCDFFNATSVEPPQPMPSARKRAAHFGGIVKVRRRGIGREYQIASPRFPGWEITYFEGLVELRIPDGVSLSVAPFEQRLGPPHETDSDYAARAAAPVQGTGTVASLDLLFPLVRGRPLCRIQVTTDGVGRVFRQQRVLRFSFQR
jgi:hypothetical protein